MIFAKKKTGRIYITYMNGYAVKDEVLRTKTLESAHRILRNRNSKIIQSAVFMDKDGARHDLISIEEQKNIKVSMNHA